MEDFSDLGTLAKVQSPQPSDGGDFSDLGVISKQQPTVPESIQEAPQQPSTQPKESNPADYISAASRGVVRGVADMALDLGDVAANAFNSSTLKGLVNKGKEINQPSQIELDNPLTSSIGAGLGYTAGAMVMPAGVVGKAIQGAAKLPVIGGLASKLLPGTGGAIQSGVGGAIREGATGALGGAAMNPDSQGWGAAIGGAVGAPLGAIGGALSAGLRTAAGQVVPELQRLKQAGIDVSSPEAVASARYALATRGQDALVEKLQTKITHNAQSEVTKIQPQSTYVPEQNPNQIITGIVKQNFEARTLKKDELYAPLTQSLETVDAPNVMAAMKTLSPKIQKLLPELKQTRLKDDILAVGDVNYPIPKSGMTFTQLQAYRQGIDGVYQQAKSLTRTGKINKTELGNILEFRKEVSNKMYELAKNQGLDGRLAEADGFYHTEYKPFTTFSKEGKINTPEQTNQVWDKINTLMGSAKPKAQEVKDLVNVLGEDGKDIVGWGLLQNAMLKNLSGGRLNLAGFNSEVNKFKVTGLDSVFAKPAYNNAVKGINRIITDGEQILKIKTNRMYVPLISPVLEHIMQSQSGINFIIKLGSMDKTSSLYRKGLQNFLTGATNLFVNQPGKNYQGEARGRSLDIQDPIQSPELPHANQNNNNQ